MITKIKRLYTLWKNPIFNERYVKRNLEAGVMHPILSKKIVLKTLKHSPWKIVFILPLYIFVRFCDNAKRRHFSGRAVFNKIKNNPIYIFYSPLYLYFYLAREISNLRYKLFKNQYIGKPYVFYRLWHNKIDVPLFELVLTTRCTLNCESCNNLMQYFSTQTAYTCSFEGIIKTLDFLFKNVSSVRQLNILGGEPLIFKDLDKVIDYLNQEEKVKAFNVVTNATIKPKEQLLKALFNARHKSFVNISDYSKTPNIHVKIQRDEIINILKEHKIQYFVRWENDSSWTEPGKIYKRGRDKNGIIKNFKSCLMPCVSVMSNECLPTDSARGGGGWTNFYLSHRFIPFSLKRFKRI